MNTCVIIPAAGSGKRFGSQTPKQYLSLNGLPLILYTLRAFETHPMVSHILLSVAEEWLDYTSSLVQSYKFNKIQPIILGGRERQFSIENALDEARRFDPDVVLVHDAVRPFASHALITSIILAAQQTGAAIPVLAVKDTVKEVESGHVIQTLDRSRLRSAQTPQGFHLKILDQAYIHARQYGISATDDASLVEAINLPVRVVDGEDTNIKVTTPLDFKLAELILQNIPPANLTSP
ncbi:MAG: 2-C-methyl-D-erythritol 4-phosphate cytidylyltransferase [Candidatus Kapaibacterium sp.]